MTRHMRTGIRFLFYISLGIMPLLSGCATIPMALMAEGADAGYGMVSGNARSFSYSRDQVHTATIHAFELMNIDVTKDKENGEQINLRGKTNHLKVYLALTTITPTLTKVLVKAKKNWFFKDSTVEAETLFQINRALRAADRQNQVSIK